MACNELSKSVYIQTFRKNTVFMKSSETGQILLAKTVYQVQQVQAVDIS